MEPETLITGKYAIWNQLQVSAQRFNQNQPQNYEMLLQSLGSLPSTLAPSSSPPRVKSHLQAKPGGWRQDGAAGEQAETTIGQRLIVAQQFFRCIPQGSQDR